MIPKNELRQMYHIESMTQQEIGEVYGVNSRTISMWMKTCDIKSRTNSEATLGRQHKASLQKPSKDWLEKMYSDKEMSQLEIANEIDVSQPTILKWMRLYEIKSRTRSETHTGENNWMWKGGISFEPYCEKFNNEFKESVRKRDDYTCQLCKCTQEPHGKKLSVHHIHYDKSDCWPDVVALCRSCNTKVNSNRDYWEEYFENQLLERGLTCWSITQET